MNLPPFTIQDLDQEAKSLATWTVRYLLSFLFLLGSCRLVGIAVAPTSNLLLCTHGLFSVLLMYKWIKHIMKVHKASQFIGELRKRLEHAKSQEELEFLVEMYTKFDAAHEKVK